MATAIAYFRVSTQAQGKSGLGLEAQEHLVGDFATREGLSIVERYTEVETGTKKRLRPKLDAAIRDAKRRGAVLLIAKLDRLARNVHFLTGLMESGVDFKACDLPMADRFTVHILAAVAEREAELISQRTKDALQAAKARGVKLGNPANLSREARKKGARAMHEAAEQAYRSAASHASLLRDRGLSYRKIAASLNDCGTPTRSGKAWTATLVHRVLSKYTSHVDG